MGNRETPDVRLKKSLRKGRVYFPPEKVVLFDDPETYRRDILGSWLQSMKAKDVREIVELENMFNLLKGAINDLTYKRLQLKGELTKRDLAKIKLMKEILVDLNKLKYGDKKVNVNVGVNYKDVQEQMFGDKSGT